MVSGTTELFAIWANQASGAMLLNVPGLDIFCPKPFELFLVKIMVNRNHNRIAAIADAIRLTSSIVLSLPNEILIVPLASSLLRPIAFST